MKKSILCGLVIYEPYLFHCQVCFLGCLYDFHRRTEGATWAFAKGSRILITLKFFIPNRLMPVISSDHGWSLAFEIGTIENIPRPNCTISSFHQHFKGPMHGKFPTRHFHGCPRSAKWWCCFEAVWFGQLQIYRWFTRMKTHLSRLKLVKRARLTQETF